MCIIGIILQQTDSNMYFTISLFLNEQRVKH